MASILLNKQAWLKTRMKSFMIFGAIVGFFTGAGLSLADGCLWPTALWRACAAALVLGILTRWWSRVWLHSLRDAVNRRRYARPNPAAKTKSIEKT
jgi:hypothetical protein